MQLFQSKTTRMAKKLKWLFLRQLKPPRKLRRTSHRQTSPRRPRTGNLRTVSPRTVSRMTTQERLNEVGEAVVVAKAEAGVRAEEVVAVARAVVNPSLMRQLPKAAPKPVVRVAGAVKAVVEVVAVVVVKAEAKTVAKPQLPSLGRIVVKAKAAVGAKVAGVDVDVVAKKEIAAAGVVVAVLAGDDAKRASNRPLTTFGEHLHQPTQARPLGMRSLQRRTVPPLGRPMRPIPQHPLTRPGTL